jgi:hypothetical protein
MGYPMPVDMAAGRVSKNERAKGEDERRSEIQALQQY